MSKEKLVKIERENGSVRYTFEPEKPTILDHILDSHEFFVWTLILAPSIFILWGMIIV